MAGRSGLRGPDIAAREPAADRDRAARRILVDAVTVEFVVGSTECPLPVANPEELPMAAEYPEALDGGT